MIIDSVRSTVLFYTLHEYFTISSSLVHSPRFSISNDILSPRLHDGASDFLGCQSKSNVQYLREIARVQIYCELRSVESSSFINTATFAGRFTSSIKISLMVLSESNSQSHCDEMLFWIDSVHKAALIFG